MKLHCDLSSSDQEYWEKYSNFQLAISLNPHRMNNMINFEIGLRKCIEQTNRTLLVSCIKESKRKHEVFSSNFSIYLDDLLSGSNRNKFALRKMFLKKCFITPTFGSLLSGISVSKVYISPDEEEQFRYGWINTLRGRIAEAVDKIDFAVISLMDCQEMKTGFFSIKPKFVHDPPCYQFNPSLDFDIGNLKQLQIS